MCRLIKQEMQIKELAIASIDEKEVIAGSYVTINYTLHILHPIDDTGYIKIVFRIVSDFGVPQFDHPNDDNYISIHTTGDCRLEPRWDTKGHLRPWGKSIYLKVMGGYLDKGDEVRIIFGDTSSGSRGWQMQTFCEDSFEFKTFIDHIATFRFTELEVSPFLKIIPGTPVQAVCIAPSQVDVKQSFKYYLKLEDYWGNPVSKPLEFTHDGLETGIHRIKQVDEKTGLIAISNPIQVGGEPYFFADFHGQSEESVGTNTIDQYFEFGRDYALLDICGHQANDFQITDSFWDKINLLAEEFNQDGSYVVFPGYEWSGNTPLGGDRNVYFAKQGGKITRSSEALIEETIFPSSPTASILFENLSSQKIPSFVFAHVGGRYADLDIHNDLEVAIEIHSAWGTFEWLLHDAFDRGYHVGIVANSDGHKGRPGASYPGRSTFGSYGGLTCVLAKNLDRENIYTAMKNRHYYATTGNRILIDCKLIVNKSKYPIGSIIETNEKEVQLDIQVQGTFEIQHVDIFNGKRLLKRIYNYNKEELGKRIIVAWRGSERRGRDRKVIWDGKLWTENNSIEEIEAFNFWNHDNQPQLMDGKVFWQSITTGGTTGVILQLLNDDGKLFITTIQGDLSCTIGDLSIDSRKWGFGGIDKQVEITKLPDRELESSIKINEDIQLENGENPLFIRVQQVDGHQAWTSPIYVEVNEK